MSRQARNRRRRHNRAGATRVLLIGGGVLVAALLIGAIAAVAYVTHVVQSAPALGKLHPRLVGGTSAVFASDGTRLGFIQSDRLRTPVGWSEIPTDLKNATVAIEDQRFYKHNGVDVTGIFRAAIKDITRGAALQGGSTITMQLVRNLYLGGYQRSLRQKIIEAKLAIDYEKHHGKRSILTSYLNSVPYGTVGGQTAIGVQAAARIFFDKPAFQLDLPQSALLAGLPQAPSQYNPFGDATAARLRRNEVLSKMAELHYIDAAQASEAERAPLEIKRGHFYSQRREDFFFEYVRGQLVHRYGASAVSQGGLKVYTTINLNMQRKARKAIAEVLNQPEDPQAAVVTLNPANGDIEAMAESQSFGQSQYNLAADGHRQPGSTFKAIDLADALSRGIDPNSTSYNSHPLSPGWLTGYPEYGVKTFGGESNGNINLVQATLKSDNTVYAQLAADLGEETITQMAYKMGVTTHLSSFPAEALGGLTLGVTPLEMSVVFATIADGGWRNSPIAITKVVFPDGHSDSNWGQPHRVKVLSESITGEETSILHQNVLGGTAVKSAIACPTAAKTGTTTELVDAWLDGFNSEYSTVVWMGYPNRRVPMTSVHGEAQQGGRLPADIWHAYMSAVTAGKPCPPLNESSTGISYQPFFGKYATTGQSKSAEEGPAPPPQAHRAPRPPARKPAAPRPSAPPQVGKTGGAEPE
jgi:penicillin-binding protein 1A